MKALFPFVLSLLLLPNATPSWALTVDEAYRAIPHKRTPYDARLSTLNSAEHEFLAQFFALADEALVERVATLSALREGRQAQFARYEQHVTRIVSTLRTLTEPASARGLVAALSQAVEHQRLFFRTAFSSADQKASLGADTNVRTASTILQRLYADLMSRYSSEHPHNREAFYQHLCGLDFL